MSERKCSCASFERLEGASVPAYIAAFLEPQGRATPEEEGRYRCRVCGREWERRAPKIGGVDGRPSLLRVN